MKDLVSKKKLLDFLQKNDIPFILHEHSAMHSVEDSKKNRGQIDGIHTKNLFLKNKKQKFYLISCYEKQNIDLKKLSKSLSMGNVSFANQDKLYEILGVKPGSVSPFGLINDKNHSVIFYLDKEILNSELVNFHPLENTSTINMKTDDFIKYCNLLGIFFYVFDFDTYSIINKINE